MLWMGTSPNAEGVARMLDEHRIGLMCQPSSNPPRAGWLWAADNGCFTTTGTWRDDRWMSWLERPHPRAGCLLATVPDVVADHDATLARWRVYSSRVRDLRYPVAFVAQDGATVRNIPWDEMDALFVGGTTEFKQGLVAERLAREARDRGLWVHIGRVNSLKRLLHWHGVADSSDGTFLAFGPDKNAGLVSAWVEALARGQQPRLEMN